MSQEVTDEPHQKDGLHPMDYTDQTPSHPDHDGLRAQHLDGWYCRQCPKDHECANCLRPLMAAQTLWHLNMAWCPDCYPVAGTHGKDCACPTCYPIPGGDVYCTCGHFGYDGHDMRQSPPACMTPGCPCGNAPARLVH